jgi:ATP phosphoribosyltransferase
MSPTMSDETMILALPSKGRLKEQVDAWLADCGFKLEMTGGARGYSAELAGLPGVSVRLLSPGDIAAGLASGEIHLGVTGEDLLREQPGEMEQRVLLLRALGFGRADLIVAVPKSWLDVDTMADLDAVSHLHLSRSGRRLRVATKYLAQTRAFFARHGLTDYRIVESSGATEGAPAAGAAEAVVDITTTGATLEANGLKILSDGLMLKSQAQLAASLSAPWSAARLVQARRLLGIVEAKARAKTLATLSWPAAKDADAEGPLAPFLERGAVRRPGGVMASQGDLFDLTSALATAGVEPVTVSRPDYVFAADSAAQAALRAAIGDI